MITLFVLVNLLSIYGLYILIKHNGLNGLLDYEVRTGNYMGFTFVFCVVGIIIMIIEVIFLMAHYLP